jgi:hypothetical protein
MPSVRKGASKSRAPRGAGTRKIALPAIALGLVDLSSRRFPLSSVSRVAHALQVQLDRDFTPVWGVAATITAFARDAMMPKDHWPLKIVDQPVGGLGIHLDEHHRPYAEIMATADWSVTASHEMVEMLVDPLGNQFIAAPDIDPHSDHHQVNYLVEVADPCETLSYDIDGVAVSDFVTRAYYDANAPSGARFDLLGKLKRALEVPRGCYLSWIDPEDGRWHQQQVDGSIVTAGRRAHPTRNPREDRDLSFGRDPARHDLSAIRTASRRAHRGSSTRAR